jgi:hypothetical protein
MDGDEPQGGGVSVFALQLWREWREHRSALLALLLVLPLGTWLFSQPLPRGALGDPFFRASVALGFVLVMLIVVGGELLGAERRGRGLGWLERLPSGLAGAFRAKLVLFLLGTIGAAAYGYGTACLVGLLRGTHASANPLFGELVPLTLLAAAWAMWTFAVSTWALRGGLALLAAALILGGLAFPIWRVIVAGYSWTHEEALWFSVLLGTSPLFGAWFAFVIGSRRGQSVLPSLLLSLAPVPAVLAITAGWSWIRLEERDVFDPFARDFETMGTLVTEDGRTAFLEARNVPERWNRRALPWHALRIDLENGTCKPIEHVVRQFTRYTEEEHGYLRGDELVILTEDSQPLVYDLRDGGSRTFERERKDNSAWHFVGLGVYRFDVTDRRGVVHDPFRSVDYPERRLGDVIFKGTLLVRPGLWLYAPSSAGWYWFDPDTRAQTPVDWPAHSEPLVLFQDGGVLLANAEEGLQLVHPESGAATTLDTQGVPVGRIRPNWNGLRVPSSIDPETATSGPIVLVTFGNEWLVLDEAATRVRRLAIDCNMCFLRRVGASQAIVGNRHGRIDRLDLETGSLTTLWPRPPAD